MQPGESISMTYDYDAVIQSSSITSGDESVYFVNDTTASITLYNTRESSKTLAQVLADATRIDRIENIFGFPKRDSFLEDEYTDLKTLGDNMDKLLASMYKYNATISSIVDDYKDLASQCETMAKLKSNNEPEQPERNP